MIMWYFVFVLLKETTSQRVARVTKHPVYVTCYWRIGLGNGNISKRLIMTLNYLEHRITYIT